MNWLSRIFNKDVPKPDKVMVARKVSKLTLHLSDGSSNHFNTSKYCEDIEKVWDNFTRWFESESPSRPYIFCCNGESYAYKWDSITRYTITKDEVME